MTEVTRRPPGQLSCLALLASCLLVLACAPGPRPALPPDPPGLAPWQLPAGSYPTQTLLRARYSGTEGEGRLRLSLRLESPARYQLAAADALGRAVWTLDVAGERALLLDHRQRRSCVYQGRFGLPWKGLGPLGFAAVPHLLLGRVPAPPAAVVTDGEALDYRDAQGHRWTLTLGAGRPIAWTMWERGRPTLWWRRNDGEAMLSHRDGGQLRWEEIVREPLPAPLPPLEPPPDYAPGRCDEPALL